MLTLFDSGCSDAQASQELNGIIQNSWRELSKLCHQEEEVSAKQLEGFPEPRLKYEKDKLEISIDAHKYR